MLTQSQKIIEIQGAAEKCSITWQQFDELKELAIKGNVSLFEIMDQSFRHSAEYQPAPFPSVATKATGLDLNIRVQLHQSRSFFLRTVYPMLHKFL